MQVSLPLLIRWEEIIGVLRDSYLDIHTLRGNVSAVKHDDLPAS